MKHFLLQGFSFILKTTEVLAFHQGEKNSWMVIFKFSVNGFNLFKLQIHFCLWNGQQENARTSVKSGNTANTPTKGSFLRAVHWKKWVCITLYLFTCYTKVNRETLNFSGICALHWQVRLMSHYTPSSNQNVSIFGRNKLDLWLIRRPITAHRDHHWQLCSSFNGASVLAISCDNPLLTLLSASQQTQGASGRPGEQHTRSHKLLYCTFCFLRARS